jgi:hypothetical protein
MDFFGAQDTIFDKTVVVKFKISTVITVNKTWMKHVQNTKNPLESPCQPINFKNLKKKIRDQKSRYFAKCLCFPNSKIHTLGYGFKNL